MADSEHSYDSWGSASERFADGSICIGIDLGTTNSCAYHWLAAVMWCTYQLGAVN